MKFHISAQQLKFYSDQGYIGFENLEIQLPTEKEGERDLWRKEHSLKHQIVHKLGPIALQLTRKTTLYLACDEWIADAWNPASAVQERLSFQGLVCIVLFSPGTPLFFLHPSTWPSMLPGWPKEPARISHKNVRKVGQDGMSDFANREAVNMKSHIDNEQFAKDDITDCPNFPRSCEKCGLAPCYLVAYGGPDARYILNPKDPLGPWLKKYGFGFGDSLKKNPIIV